MATRTKALHFDPTSNGDYTTDPNDPTRRTLEQSRRDIEALREYLVAIIDGNRGEIGAQLTGNAKAVELLQVATDKQPKLISEAVAQLEALQNETFRSIQTQFVERDKRTEQLSIADKTAIAAALQAQKEAAGATNDSNNAAVTKMENNFAKLIEQTQNLLQQSTKNFDDKIDDLKNRLTTIEGRTSISDPALANAAAELKTMVAGLTASSNQGSGHSKGVDDSWAKMIALGMFLVAIAAVVITLVTHFAK